MIDEDFDVERSFSEHDVCQFLTARLRVRKTQMAWQTMVLDKISSFQRGTYQIY